MPTNIEILFPKTNKIIIYSRNILFRETDSVDSINL